MNTPTLGSGTVPEHDYWFLISDIAPTDGLRELTADDFEDILDRTDAIWIHRRTDWDNGRYAAHYYDLAIGTDSTVHQVKFEQSGREKTANGVLFSESAPVNTRWTIVTEIFRTLLGRRLAALDGCSRRARLTPAAARLTGLDEVDKRAYRNAHQDLLNETEQYVASLVDGDFDGLRMAIATYNEKHRTLVDQYC